MSYLGTQRSQKRPLRVFSGSAIVTPLSRIPGCDKYWHRNMVECCCHVNEVRERPKGAPTHNECEDYKGFS